jgi:hypothetical protein
LLLHFVRAVIANAPVVVIFGLTQIMKLCLLGFILVILLQIDSISQSNQDSTDIIQSIEKVLALYERTMEGVHHLYNVSEYIAYEPIDDEYPYFKTDEWTYSQLKYDDEWFRNVPLLFDIDKNQLIASYYYNGTKMQLVQNRVDEFILADHHFINIKESIDSTTIRPGFYELLYNGQTQILARRSKNFIERIEETQEVKFFKESNQIFIIYSGIPFRINSKHDMLRVLKSKKSDLKIYIRENHLFEKDKENSIIRLTQYFDRIIQK